MAPAHALLGEVLVVAETENVLDAEELAVLVGIALDTAEEAPLGRGHVADVGLLLLVDLADVDELLDRAGGDHPVDVDVARLAPAVGAVHGLEVVRRVPWSSARLDCDDAQFGSRMTTLFAATRLSPTPPAMVEMRKEKTLGSVLNSSQRPSRLCCGTPPSRYLKSGWSSSNHCRIALSSRTEREKMRTLSPLDRH